MKADTVDLAAIFQQQVCYRIPMFQRPYVWSEEKEWAPLWEDILAVLERQIDDTPTNDQLPHFLGAVVFDQVLNPAWKVQARYVIDGQQRLTTLQMFLAAARSVAAEHGLEDASREFGMLLLNQEFLVRDNPADRFKVGPSKFDRDAFIAVVDASDGGAQPQGDHLILRAYRYFRDAIVRWAVEEHSHDETSRRIAILSTVLWKLLVVVAIELESRDNAQVIFETLNARGTPLLAADLIKNHLFQVAVAGGFDIDALYGAHWEAFDRKWWRKPVQVGRLSRPRLDIFMNHWLSMRLGREVVAHQLFPEFKRFLTTTEQTVVDLLAELAEYGTVYETFATEADRFVHDGRGSQLARLLYRLNTMEVTTAYPFLLWLSGPEGIPGEAEQLRAMTAIDSWLARRVIVRGNTQGYTSIFLALLANLRKVEAPTGSDVAAYLRSLEGERGYWPTDEQVGAALLAEPSLSATAPAPPANDPGVDRGGTSAEGRRGGPGSSPRPDGGACASAGLARQMAASGYWMIQRRRRNAGTCSSIRSGISCSSRDD